MNIQIHACDDDKKLWKATLTNKDNGDKYKPDTHTIGGDATIPLVDGPKGLLERIIKRIKREWSHVDILVLSKCTVKEDPGARIYIEEKVKAYLKERNQKRLKKSNELVEGVSNIFIE